MVKIKFGDLDWTVHAALLAIMVISALAGRAGQRAALDELATPDGVAVVHSGGRTTLAGHDHLDVRECPGCDERALQIGRVGSLQVLEQLGKVQRTRQGVAWVGS